MIIKEVRRRTWRDDEGAECYWEKLTVADGTYSAPTSRTLIAGPKKWFLPTFPRPLVWLVGIGLFLWSPWAFLWSAGFIWLLRKVGQ